MNTWMMSIKVGFLLEHHLWIFKDFNCCGRKVESFLWLLLLLFFLKKGGKDNFFIFLDPQLHNNVHFDSKLGLPPVSFLEQAAYGFEA